MLSGLKSSQQSVCRVYWPNDAPSRGEWLVVGWNVAHFTCVVAGFIPASTAAVAQVSAVLHHAFLSYAADDLLAAVDQAPSCIGLWLPHAVSRPTRAAERVPVEHSASVLSARRHAALWVRLTQALPCAGGACAPGHAALHCLGFPHEPPLQVVLYQPPRPWRQEAINFPGAAHPSSASQGSSSPKPGLDLPQLCTILAQINTALPVRAIINAALQGLQPGARPTCSAQLCISAAVREAERDDAMPETAESTPGPAPECSACRCITASSQQWCVLAAQAVPAQVVQGFRAAAGVPEDPGASAKPLESEPSWRTTCKCAAFSAILPITWLLWALCQAVMWLIGPRGMAAKLRLPALTTYSGYARALYTRLFELSVLPIAGAVLQQEGRHWQPPARLTTRWLALWSAAVRVAVDLSVGAIFAVGIAALPSAMAGGVWARLQGALQFLHARVLLENLEWLMVMPAGLKLNHELSALLGHVGLTCVQLWELVTARLTLWAGVVELGMAATACLGVSLSASLAADVLDVATAHVFLLQVVLAKLHAAQMRALTALWRLFRGKKQNALRGRVDSQSYSAPLLLLGTVLFVAVGMLLPTTLVYYTFFSLVWGGALALQGCLWLMSAALHHAPWFEMYTRWTRPSALTATFTVAVVPTADGAAAGPKQRSAGSEPPMPLILELRPQAASSAELADDLRVTWRMLSKHYALGKVARSWVFGKHIPSCTALQEARLPAGAAPSWASTRAALQVLCIGRRSRPETSAADGSEDSCTDSSCGSPNRVSPAALRQRATAARAAPDS